MKNPEDIDREDALPDDIDATPFTHFLYTVATLIYNINKPIYIV